MIQAYTGKPGGGKSYRALKREILAELIYGTRYVTVNVSLDVGKLNAYIERKFPGLDVDLFRRLRVLNEDEAREFWLHPRPGVDLVNVSVGEQREGKFVDLSKYPDTLFVIDEAHRFFDAQQWMKEGPGLTHVNSQHRKLNWEIVFVTQFPELLSKRVRGFVQEWHNCRNYGLEKMFSVFRMPKRFAVKITQNEPSRESQPGNWEFYRLDPEVAELYDTSAGVGVPGRKMPEQRKVKGLSVGWIAVGVAVGLALLFFGPEFLAKKALGSSGGKRISERVVGSPGAVAALTPAGAAVPAVYGKTASSDNIQAGMGNVPVRADLRAMGKVPGVDGGELVGAVPSVVHPIGYAVRGSRVIVSMSDGSTRTGGFGYDDGISEVRPNSVIWSGDVHYLQMPKGGIARYGPGSKDGQKMDGVAAETVKNDADERVGPYVRGSDGVMHIDDQAQQMTIGNPGRSHPGAAGGSASNYGPSVGRGVASGPLRR